VAAEASFADQAHFSLHFRRAYGLSPRWRSGALPAANLKRRQFSQFENRMLHGCLFSKLNHLPSKVMASLEKGVRINKKNKRSI
jgi:AraC-like DNA-binding protein